jgi:hypothetical protein
MLLIQANADTHLIFDIVSAAVTVGWLIVGLAIKNSLADIKLTQAQDKADLVEKQTEIKEDLNEKHAENTQTLAVHLAEDTQQFSAISRTLARMDNKLDKVVNWRSH